ncbi:DMT family transporter [Diaphorobacter aerolatus]|uniref:EamA family transporter n=1 Tax=Diaphorobacter aerolatus TaxID=1288495 RepID=A0A7H0GNR3_9BURK|nr:EamA family transporter [Diaphorobacter aerolatus]QNP49929.1 EamA family transporter [Diaphorobacter aerolatus]
MNLLITSITILCVVGISVGQMLFKKAASGIPTDFVWRDWILNPWLITALVLYGITTLVWIWVLRYAPLHLAYPFMGLAFLIVPCLGWLFLGESVQMPTVIGGIFILLGIGIASRAT